MIVGFYTVTNASISQDSIDGALRPTFRQSLAAAGFVAPGGQICALEYRKVCHRWLSSKRIDKSRLSKVCHPSMERSRGEKDGEDDIVEVELTGLDGGWDKEVVGDEVLFIRSFKES
ncbi:hypothetical protein V8E54_012286 [Elaphomyces granulatus]